jgi:hypothetical protein
MDILSRNSPRIHVYIAGTRRDIVGRLSWTTDIGGDLQFPTKSHDL